MSHAAVPLSEATIRAGHPAGKVGLLVLRLGILTCLGAVGFAFANTLVQLL